MANALIDPPQQDDEHNAVYDIPGNTPQPTTTERIGKDHNTPTNEELAVAEENASDGKNLYGNIETNTSHQVGRGYRKQVDKSRELSRIFGNRRRLMIIGGVGASIAALATSAFLFLLPMKVVSIMETLDKHYSASTNNAVDKETNQLLSNYIKKHVLPGLKKQGSCGTSSVISTIDRNCRTTVQGDGLVTKLYKSWAQARLENTLATNYGIEFQRVGNNYLMKAPGLGLGDETFNIDGFVSSGDDVSLSDFIAKDPQFQKFNSTNDFKANISAKLTKAMENESKYREVMTKYKVAKLLEQKYGIKRCVIACSTRRDFSDWKNKKIAAATIQTQRVIQPNNKILAFVLGCIADKNSAGCDVLEKENSSSEPQVDADGCKSNCIESGAPLSAADDEVESTVTALAGEYALTNAEDIAKAQQTYTDLSGNGGFKKYYAKLVAKNLVSAFGGSDETVQKAGDLAGKLAANEVPGVGLIVLSSQINTMADTAGAILPAMGYIMQSQTMIHEYAIYRTFADEIMYPSAPKDATIVGSFADSLGGGNHNADNTNDTEVGGTASAEQSPLYNQLINGGTVYGPSSPNYICDNGKPVPAGQSVCDEEKVNSKAKIDVNSITSKEPAILRQASGYVSDISNFVAKLAGSLLKLTGLNSIAGDATAAFIHTAGIDNLMNDLGNYLKSEFLPTPPIGTNTSGARTFDMIAAGNDLSVASYNHIGLGGVTLSTQQNEAILDSQQTQESLQFNNQPVLARLFDKNNGSSIISKVALAVPASSTEARADIANIFTNPLGKLASIFTQVIKTGHAKATTIQNDPFGITQYGYPVNDPVFSQDPEKYWDEHCTTNAETVAWNQSAANQAKNNPEGLADNLQPSQGGGVSPTSDPVGTNPCLLIQATVSSVGALYDSSLLGPGDSSASSAVSTSEIAGTNVDTASLDSDSTSIACANGTRDIGIQTGYYNNNAVSIRLCAIPDLPSSGSESNGQYGVSGANGQAVVNSRVSGAVYSMVQAAAQDGLNLAADSSFRSMSHQTCLYNHTCGNADAATPGYSNHQMGLAIDFSVPLCNTKINDQCSDPGNPMWDWLNNNASKFGYKSGVPSEAWHWSPTGN